MKIRPGQPLRAQKIAAHVQDSAANNHFQVLLDGQLLDTSEKKPDFTADKDATADQRQQLFNDATRLLDEAIEQIEAEHAPRKQTVESLQKVRQKLAGMNMAGSDLTTANTILAVETERLKSW